MADPVPEPGRMTPPADRRLLDAVVAIADGLELEPTLRRIVRAAADLTSAPYAALGVLDEGGLHRAFVHTGISPDAVTLIGRLPAGHGVLGHITRVGRAVRVPDISRHPAAVGFPEHHPTMTTFLGVPVGIGDRLIGNLYLADKAGGFTAEDEDVVVALAAAAAVAVDNARLYEAARRREAWMAAAQQVTTAMLSGTEEEDALELVATRARQVADASVAALVLPGWDDQWVLEVADGEDAGELIGTVMPPDGPAVTAIHEGTGRRLSDLWAETKAVASMRRFGPALYAPLVAGEDATGVLVLLRVKDSRPFTEQDLATAETFAGQAAPTTAPHIETAVRRASIAPTPDGRRRMASSTSGGTGPVGGTSSTGPLFRPATGPTARASGKFIPVEMYTVLAAAKLAWLSSAAVMYRFEPPYRTTLAEGSSDRTALSAPAVTVGTDPRMTTSAGLSRASSAAVAGWRTSPVSSSGSPSRAATAEAARLSGKLRPVARYTRFAWLAFGCSCWLMRTAVSYRLFPAMRLTG